MKAETRRRMNRSPCLRVSVSPRPRVGASFILHNSCPILWLWLRAVFSLRSLLDVRGRVGRLAVRLSVVNLDLADAPGRGDRLLAERRLEDPDGDERAVH